MGARSSQSRGPGLNKTDGHLLEYFRQNFGAGGGGTNAPPGILSGLTATGGVISDYTDGPAVYRAHIFTSSGTFDVTDDTSDFGATVEYLVVAGGGGGGGGAAAAGGRGGGGAGGLRTNLTGHPLAGSSFPVSTSPGSYTVTVGAGGAPGPSSPDSGTRGVSSSFGPITSTGGGGGGITGDPLYAANKDGGSGGGNYNPTGVGLGNTPPTSPPQGNNAGNGSGSTASGGGGAGDVGGNAPPTAGGVGGPGVQVAIAGPAADTTGVGALNPGPGEYQWFAGGGGGGGTWGATPGVGGVGGVGGGGDGKGKPTYGNGDSGQASTGGGGGGVSGSGPGGTGYNGGAGGSGIVVVRYQIGQLAAEAKATGGAISYYDGKTIHVFTSSGDFNNTTGSPLTVEYVMVGGGGGGGHYVGGGGGAGGFITGPSVVGPGPKAVIVGAGGKGAYHAPYPSTATERGDQGVDTTFNSLTAGGGGGGGSGYTGSYLPGGSVPLGSGGGGSYEGGTGGTGGPQGNNGAAGVPGPTDHRGGGGGGSGQAGQPVVTGPPYLGSPGGYGTQAPSTFRDPKASYGDPGTYGDGTAPTPGGFWFAGGGGGGSDSPPARSGGKGGSGGGGKGGGIISGDTDLSYGGQQNTGGGGGGSEINLVPYGEPNTAPSGGSGIVIIAYPS